jgi:epoxyqueuosine reductase QueG
MGPPHFGVVADVSLRHAAVAAGLGVFGRHNLVIHPRFGTRILFTAVLTDLALPSDPPVTDELCNDCGLCVEGCPAKALETEGRTEDMKCLRVSQPYGIGSAIGFIRKVAGATPEEQKAMFMDPRFLNLYQASFIGFQYECFRCMAVCPACR